MTDDLTTDWLEARLHYAAAALPYPATPEMASAVSRRLRTARTRPGAARTWLAWALAAGLIVLAALAVPEVRAGLLEFLQLGAVRIRLIEPTPTVTLTPAPTVAGTPHPQTATPTPSPTPLSTVLDLAGRATLEGAQNLARFPIRLPTYPPGLEAPDEVFVQDLGGGPLVVVVWTDPAHPNQVMLSLHEFGPDSNAAEKSAPEIVLVTSVNGQEALWTEGPHMLQMTDGDFRLRRLVEGNVLIWTEAEITYRLETDLPLEEAVRIAESLR